jgi:platelet-activating factor acetylhydrolase
MLTSYTNRFFPRLLHYISIPARKNAPLLKPADSARWPVMIFSHGLAGSRNAYSHLVGSIASHGVIVIAPEHRDGSTPISYIRDVPKTTANGEKTPVNYSKRTIGYKRMPHVPSPEVEAGRTAQLTTRMWEMGCIHDSIMKIAEGKILSNLNTSSISLSPFANQMEVHQPGSIIFAGHSFGAATVAQFVKSTFYSSQTSEAPVSYEPIFTPSSRSAIVKQITPDTPVILLDMWCLPLRASTTRWLWNKPFPCYAPGGPGGSGLLAVESETFYKWRVHLKATKAFLTPNPADPKMTVEKDGRPGPHIFYATASAHLNQSDFAILFPYVTKRMFQCEEPERLLRLNVRAILQLLRQRSFPIASTSASDMELGSETSLDSMAMKDDTMILSTKPDIRGWNHIDTDLTGFEDVDYDEDSKVAMKEGATDASVGDEITNKGEVIEPAGKPTMTV